MLRVRIRRLALLCGLLLCCGLAIGCGGKDPSPDEVNRTLQRGIEAHRAGSLDQAEALYRQVLKTEPKNKFALFDLGLVQDTRGDLRAAEAYYRLSIAVDPGFSSPLFNLAILQAKLGAVSQAAELYQRVLAVDPGNPYALDNLEALLAAPAPVQPSAPASQPSATISADHGHVAVTDVLLLALLVLLSCGAVVYGVRRLPVAPLAAAADSEAPVVAAAPAADIYARPLPAPKTPAHDDAASRTKVAFGIYLLLLPVYLITASGHFYSTDHLGVYLTAQSLFERQSLAIEGVGETGSGGRNYATSEPGQALASIPLYALGKLVESIAPSSVDAYFAGHQLGVPPEPAWGGTVPIFFVSLFNQLLMPLVCVVFFFIALQLGFSLRVSFWLTIVYGIGTTAWVQAHEYFQHPLETLFLLCALYMLLKARGDGSSRYILAAGLLLGIGIFTRANLAVVGPVMLAYVIWLRLTALSPPEEHGQPLAARVRSYLRHAGRDELRIYALYLAPQALGVVAVLFFNYLRWDSLSSAYRGDDDGSLSLGNLPGGVYGLLLTPGRSIFLYSPPIIAGALLFRRFLREHTATAVLILSIAAAYLLLYGAFLYWHGAGCWGPRYLTAVMPLLLLPAGYALQRKSAAIWLGCLTAAGVFMGLLGVVINPVYAEQWRGLWGGGITQPFQGNAYLYVPNISPPVVHFRDFFAGRNWDLWLQFVLHENGVLVFGLTLLLPLALFVAGVWLLRQSGLLPTTLLGGWSLPARPQPAAGTVATDTQP